MLYCTQCGHANVDSAEKCANCGKILRQRCPNCGELVPAEGQFCILCGACLAESGALSSASSSDNRLYSVLRLLMPDALATKISHAVAGTVGERREVAVLHVGMESLSTRESPAGHKLPVDNEILYLLSDEAIHVLADVIYQYEGTVDKFSGDSLVALFGMPLAHENNAERAVRAALDILLALQPLKADFQERYGIDFRIHIGIHTGTVIVGQVDNDLHINCTVVGNTFDLAAALVAAADEDTVLVSFEVYQRTHPLIAYEAQPLVTFGKPSRSIRVFRPLYVQADRNAARSLFDIHAPMVGRRTILESLQQAFDDICNTQRSRVALVTGEVGLGKSRLMREFREAVSHSGVPIYQGNCVTYARAKPLHLFANLLRDIFYLAESDPPDVQLEALRASLDRLGMNTPDILSYVSSVLGLEHGDDSIKMHLRGIDDAVLQKMTHTFLQQIIVATARLTPVVLIFEDLHWVDAASRDVLVHLLRTIDDVPLLLILVSRDVEPDTTIQPLIAAANERHDALLDLYLSPLPDADLAQLVDQLVVEFTDEAQALKRRIAERADGNPLCAEEIVRMLIDNGGLTLSEGCWHVTESATTLVEQLPGTLNGLVMARFDRLPESARSLLQKAAVLGYTFPVDVLKYIAGVSTNDVDTDLDLLVARKFVIPETPESAQVYTFCHTLTQEAVYATLLKRDRYRFHLQVAQIIEDSDAWLSSERIEALAYHYAESANPEKAIPHLVAAAENAAHRCDYEMAVTRYQNALSLVALSGGENQCDLLATRIGLGRALKYTGKYGEASQVLEQALRDGLYLQAKPRMQQVMPQLVRGLNELADIRHREGASEKAIEYLKASLATIDNQGRQDYLPLWRTVVDRMAWVLFHQGKLSEAFELADSAAASVDLEQAEDPIILASLYNTLGGVLWQQGNLSEAITYVERSLRLYERIDYQWGMANANGNLGVLHYTLGNWPSAADILARAEMLQKRVGDLQHRAITLNNLGTLHLAMGQHEAAHQDLASSLGIFERLGDAWGAAQVHVGMARLALIQSRFADAIAHADAGLQMMDTAGTYGVEARWIKALSLAETDFLRSLSEVEAALRTAQEAGLTEQEADCCRVLGALHARTGNYLKAENLLRESVDLSLQANAPYARGLALMELGKLYEAITRDQQTEREEWRAKALNAYHEAAEQFHRLGAAFDLQSVQETINALESQPEALVPEVEPPGQSQAAVEMQEQAALEGGRRAATVLWFNLIPDEKADEDAFETIALLMPALVTIVQEYQGQLVQRSDGLTVVFGAPAAYEDDADRAVQTAWHLVRYLAEHTRQLDVRLNFNAALSQGEVVAGFIGPRSQTTFDVRGEPVQEVRLLSDHVPPGEVWVTESVRALTERISVYRPVAVDAAHPLAAMTVWILDGFRIQPRPARGLSGIQTRLIGREALLQAMLQLAENFSRGIGGLVWLEGEPGIGKSRLMQEFSLRLKDSGAVVLEGRCSPQKSSHAFSLFSEVLLQVFDVQPYDAPDHIRAKIGRAFESWPRDTLPTRPYLEVLLGLWPEGLMGDRLASLEPEQLRQQTSVALRRLFKSLSTQSPLVVLLDDLHWIDPVSAELLQFLITIVATAPILFVCAQRRQGGDAPNDQLVRVQSLIPSQTLRFLLERLTMEERETLLSELLPQTDLQPDLRTYILTQSDGNPYFIEEYIRMFIDQGYLQYRNNRWVMRADITPQQVELPASLETLIRSRVDALPQDLREVLQVATVLGAPVETEVLQSVTERPETPTALARLASRLLMQRGAEEGQWFFHHSLIENVVYTSLLRTRQRALHLKVALVLEERWAGAESEHAEVLAYHLLRAGQNNEALAYLMTAGERAAARFANEAAITYFEQAAEILSMQPSVPDSIRWRLAAGLGDVYRALGRYADSMAALKAGLALMHTGTLSGHLRAGLYRRMGKTAHQMGSFELAHQYYEAATEILGEPDTAETNTEMSRTLNGLAYLLLQQGQLEEARTTCQESMVFARRAGDISGLATLENIMGGIHYQQRAWSQAAHHTRRAMALREQMGYTWGVASTLSNLGLLAVLEGEWHQAKSFFARSLVLRKEIGDIEGVALVHNNLGTLNRDQGSLDDAEKHFFESLNVARLFNMGFHIANSTVGLAQALWLKGDKDAARQQTEIGLKLAVDLGVKETLVEVYRLEVEMQMEARAWNEAEASAMQALEYADALGNRGLQASLWRLMSELELQRGDQSAAHEALDKAREALSDATEVLEVGRIKAQASRLAYSEARYNEAAQEMHAARKIFRRLGAVLDLERSERV
ncbi:MAG: tetratricopeptide repeat protein [Anaerolineae bacterium]|nr:tetratricopeptide repeat protein [Anaerolineae bacterium]